MINDRFYVHAPEAPLNETPTRTRKKPKPASRKTGLVRLVRGLVLLLAVLAGLRYLPGLLLAALPGWQNLFSVCAPADLVRLAGQLALLLPAGILVSIVLEFCKLVHAKKPHKQIAVFLYGFLVSVWELVRTAAGLFLPEASASKEKPRPVEGTEPFRIDPDLLEKLDDRLEQDFAAARNNKTKEA